MFKFLSISNRTFIGRISQRLSIMRFQLLPRLLYICSLLLHSPTKIFAEVNAEQVVSVAKSTNSVTPDLVLVGLVDGTLILLDATNGDVLLHSDIVGKSMISQCAYHQKADVQSSSLSLVAPLDDSNQLDKINKVKNMYKSNHAVVPALDGTLWSVLTLDDLQVSKLRWTIQDIQDSDAPVGFMKYLLRK
jgi:hypothetical protein